MDTTPAEAAQVVALLQAGMSQRSVAHRLHISRRAVQNVYHRYLETGGFIRRRGTGRHRATSARDDRYIVSSSLRNRRLNSVQLQHRLREVRRVSISRWTVRRRLHESNLRAHRAAIGPVLSRAHRQARLQFARDHIEWTIEQWRSVLFTDETRVSLRGTDRRQPVYRRPGERFAEACIVERAAFDGGSTMFWAGISLDGRTELVHVPSIRRGRRWEGLNAHRYITEVLEPHVMPYAQFIGDSFTLMHDNARPHTAASVRDYLAEIGIPVLRWPANSPDLNPIEHLWDMLKRKIRARDHAPTTIQEVVQAAQEEWDLIPQHEVIKLIRSMQNRLRECIRARGGHTHY